jgi:hypothetical protein
VTHIGEELRLVLACLCKLAALVLNLVEQPHVLDRDHGLVGEGLHKFNLFVGKGTGGGSCEPDHANRISFSQQRHPEQRAQTGALHCFGESIF